MYGGKDDVVAYCWVLDFAGRPNAAVSAGIACGCDARPDNEMLR